MTSVFELNAHEYNKKLAEALKQIPEIKAPEWVDYVKSSSSKERPIAEPDFWFKRTASILRQIYKKEIVGVQRLRTKYGSKKNRGHKPERFRRGSGKIIRVILQQTDNADLTEKVKSPKAGRKLTEKGKKFLEDVK